MKPVDSVAQAAQDAESYCRYVRRDGTAWKCGLITRMTGADACLSEDWNGCKLNGGGKPATDMVEKLT